MNKARYLIRINSKKITNDTVPCTGKQAYRIITVINANFPSCIWFAADIVDNNSRFLNYNEPYPQKLGRCEDFINKLSNVDQFLSGILLAVPDNIRIPNWGDRVFITDEQPFDEMGDAILEIRFFDTTYFEIYAYDFNLLEIIASEFAETIIECKV